MKVGAPVASRLGTWDSMKRFFSYDTLNRLQSANIT
jgi:hypothetical protein